VLAAYTDLLPSPIQQLAHVTVAAPAPPRPNPRPHAPSPTGRHTEQSVPSPSSQSSPAPRRSASPAPAPSYRGMPKPRYTPVPTSSAGHRTAQPICTPGSWRAGVPSAPPTSLPSWAPSQGVHCTGYPTGPARQPTPNQDAH
jgi:hypothetical protein